MLQILKCFTNNPPGINPLFCFHLCVDLPQLCQAKGFVCEFCGNDKDIIFPFQLNKCQRCEGEPSLLVAGVSGSRAPSPRLSVLLNWRDWKVRRLARTLSQERREGEGGEEDLELDVDEEKNSGEQEERRIIKEELRETAKDRKERGRIFQTFTVGKLVKVFLKSKVNKEEQERTESKQRGNDQGEVDSKQSGRSKERGDRHANKEKVNLLKVLQIDRLKKSISKGDESDSDSEICSSIESLNEVGQERNGLWKVSGFSSLAKGFTEKEKESEGKAGWETGESHEKRDKGKIEEAETVKTEFGAEKFTVLKLRKPQNLLTAFSSGNIKREEEDNMRESDGKKVDADQDQHKPASLKQFNWRGIKTRKARRGTRGRKVREGTEGGERDDVNDKDDCTEEEKQ